MNNRNKILKLVFAAMFLALAYVMPFLTGQIPEIGAMLCPLHIPVILCGFVCGWPWGLAVGFAAPLLSSLINAMPKIFPDATVMTFELAAYGAVAGLLYQLLSRKPGVGRICITLVTAMVAGRVVYGIVYFFLVGLNLVRIDEALLVYIWVRTIVKPLPGMILQVILVPLLVIALERAGLTLNNRRKSA